jgi:hypothetical protein
MSRTPRAVHGIDAPSPARRHVRFRRRGVAGKDSLPPGSTTVEIELTADGSDTVVELFHHDLPAEELDSHLKGWTTVFGRLVQLRT